jgi:hypothetical protein
MEINGTSGEVRLSAMLVAIFENAYKLELKQRNRKQYFFSHSIGDGTNLAGIFLQVSHTLS